MNSSSQENPLDILNSSNKTSPRRGRGGGRGRGNSSRGGNSQQNRGRSQNIGTIPTGDVAASSSELPTKGENSADSERRQFQPPRQNPAFRQHNSFPTPANNANSSGTVNNGAVQENPSRQQRRRNGQNRSVIPKTPTPPREKVQLTQNTSNLSEHASSDSINQKSDTPTHSISNNSKRRQRKDKGLIKVAKPDGLVLPDDLLGSLEVGLSRERYECMVCYEFVRVRDATWPCNTCYAVFHLKCIQKWAEKSVSSTSTTSNEVGWRCPGCQQINKDVPEEYRCFCGKTESPEFQRGQTPHSCGLPCLKARSCPHRCNMMCHPGPCRPCESLSSPVKCYCGKTQFVVRCSELDNAKFEKSCGDVCGELLDCKQHRCEKTCHVGACLPCPIKVTQTCFCGRHTREVPCGPPSLQSASYSCQHTCDFEFECGIHKCESKCHPTAKHCKKCPTDPQVVIRCPCGSKTIEELGGRQKCTDPVRLCGNECQKVQSCGHRCRAKCHAGDCPPCQQRIKTQCRCKASMLDVPCRNLPHDEQGNALPPLCDRVCKKQKHCRRHRCMEICCPIEFHLCESLCGKLLKCGKHNCLNSCGHEGRCHDCVEGVSFEELRCHCGRTVQYPPIPCNSSPPKCNHPCTRELPCGHESLSEHNCHPDSEPCPPCVIFISRDCACGKRTMHNIPCSRVGAPSCGEPCHKIISTCEHPCRRFCHDGPCIDNTHPCTQKCGRTRTICGHTCSFQCHGKKFCDEAKPCTEKVVVTCKCGNKSINTTCGAWKESIGRQPLTCDDSCLLAERNKKLREAFGKLPGGPSPVEKETIFDAALRYTESVVKHAHANLTWTLSIEKTLREFVASSNRMYVFPHTKKANNAFISKLAVHYNLVAELVDTHFEGMASVMIRKKLTPATIPQILVSEVAAVYKPSLFTQAYAAALAASAAAAEEESSNNQKPEKVIKKPSTPLNGIFIEGILHGMDSSDIQILIDGIFGTTNATAMKWKDHTCIVSFSPIKGSKVTPEEIEIELLSAENAIQTRFVGNTYAKSVKYCWVTPAGDVVVKDEEVKEKAAAVLKKESVKIIANPFGVLEDVKEDNKIAQEANEGDQAEIENWEDLDTETVEQNVATSEENPETAGDKESHDNFNI